HWLDGESGAVIPFSANDNGADLVETSFLVQGLLCARQYFNGADANEVKLREDINIITDRVEWNWFRQNNQEVLYWHWSPDKAWTANLKIQGWNECLITYVLAAASKNYSIPKTVYDMGWARNGAMKNGKTFYNYMLPLGQDYGGPLFFSHYSFLGINPKGLSDAYANYETQTRNHTLINYNFCKANPNGYFGYSDSVWGLTASNIKNGYTASSPANDQGFIAPTAAISSIPYTPNESMAALQFYYYVLGDKLFKDYGFVVVFRVDVIKNNGAWFDDAFLAIDQGPIIVMIENHRSQLLWNLFMGAPEVESGLSKLGFSGF
ncbi:MAG TPA: glucoamylase family protein, partial [Niabella sp.]|nr:glucoamylase family protein [Niabella sp.]